MDEYKIIDAIEYDPVYSIDLDLSKIKTPYLNSVLEFIFSSNLTDKQVLSFMKHKYNCFRELMLLLPFTKVLSLYQNFGFLKNYWSSELLNTFLDINRRRLDIAILNGENIKSEMICLNNQFNQYFNFTDKVFLSRLKEIEKRFSDINWDDFYLGTNMIISIANHELYSNLISTEFNIETFETSETNFFEWNIYPKNRNLTLKQPGNSVFLVDKGNTLFYLPNKKVRINIKRLYYNSPDDLIFSKNEGVMFDGEIIWSTANFYQLFNLPLKKFGKKCDNLVEQRYSIKESLGCHTEQENEIVKYEWEGLKIIKSFTLSNAEEYPKCYMCNKYYLGRLYLDRYKFLCFSCSFFNYNKRIFSISLKEKNIKAFISGIRHKIGYCTSLKLLRAGAIVIGTTRFPNFTWYNYSQQKDFNEWKDRLYVFQCNFLQLDKVDQLVKYLIEQKVNIIINNACQTVRPTIKYVKQIQTLEYLLKSREQNLLDSIKFNNDLPLIPMINDMAKYNFLDDDCGILPYPEWSTLKLLEIERRLKDHDISFNQFYDIKDSRGNSSWHKQIEDIKPGEIVEANFVNQLVPTLILNQVKSSMKKPSFIVNVTAKEGQFHCKKNGYHAHTNMCKSAMNMLIRTIAEEKEKGFRVYAINPGYVSPQIDDFPLSAEDGSSRILDPIFQFFNETPLSYECVNLKNYVKTEW